MTQWLQCSDCKKNMKNVFPNKMQRLVRGGNLYYLIFLGASCHYSLLFFLLFCHSCFPFSLLILSILFFLNFIILQVSPCFSDIFQTIQLFLKFILITSLDLRETPVLLVSREAHLNLISLI